MAIRILPELSDFLLAGSQRRVVSVHTTVMADDLTAVSVYDRLCADRPNTFLLESADAGTWSRYSFIGVNAAATLTEENGRAVWHWAGRPISGLPSDIDPLLALARTIEMLHTPRDPDLPPLVSGMVGYLGYDVVRRLEVLPDSIPMIWNCRNW